MPIKITYDPERNILYETGEGEISYKEFVEHRKMLLAYPAKPSSRALVLCDYRTARIDFSPEEMWRIKKMSNRVAEAFGGARVAIVASDDFGYGMARMYSMASEAGDFMVEAFKTMAEACAWLGIEVPEGGSS
jgi:hypothetical protein